jgi:hypothetical protein
MSLPDELARFVRSNPFRRSKQICARRSPPVGDDRFDLLGDVMTPNPPATRFTPLPRCRCCRRTHGGGAPPRRKRTIQPRSAYHQPTVRAPAIGEPAPIGGPSEDDRSTADPSIRQPVAGSSRRTIRSPSVNGPSERPAACPWRTVGRPLARRCGVSVCSPSPGPSGSSAPPSWPPSCQPSGRRNLGEPCGDHLSDDALSVCSPSSRRPTAILSSRSAVALAVRVIHQRRSSDHHLICTQTPTILTQHLLTALVLPTVLKTICKTSS